MVRSGVAGMRLAPCDAPLNVAWFAAGPDRLTGLPNICKFYLTGESLTFGADTDH
jgi:hypothetical protein